jgi:hypothetical protein
VIAQLDTGRAISAASGVITFGFLDGPTALLRCATAVSPVTPVSPNSRCAIAEPIPAAEPSRCAGQLRSYSRGGENLLDGDGDGAADFTIRLGSAAAAVSDFFL